MLLRSDGGGFAKPKTKAQIEKDERDRLAKIEAEKAALLATEKRRDAVMASRNPASSSTVPDFSRGTYEIVTVATKQPVNNKPATNKPKPNPVAKQPANTPNLQPQPLPIELPTSSAPVVNDQVYDTPAVNAEPWTPVSWQLENNTTEDPEVFVKSAAIETIQFADEPFDENLVKDLLFEDFAGQEILSIARNDTVNGQSVIYQPIKNLRVLQQIYSPTNLLQLQETSDKLFDNFIIKLGDKIPRVGNGTPEFGGTQGGNYYLNESGDLIIEFVNMKSDEQVEIQISRTGIIDEAGI